MSLQPTQREKNATRQVNADYLYGCPECEWWDNGSEPDFGNCPSCGQPKVVWNQTDAEAETDHEQMLEDQIEILYC